MSKSMLWHILCIFCACNCMLKAFFAYSAIFSSYLLHMSALCVRARARVYSFLFQLTLCISMHIYCLSEHTNAHNCIFQFFRSILLASSEPFQLHFCSTSQQQCCVNSDSSLPVHTLIHTAQREGAKAHGPDSTSTPRGLEKLCQ